jgi:hypothetical protein
MRGAAAAAAAAAGAGLAGFWVVRAWGVGGVRDKIGVDADVGGSKGNLWGKKVAGFYRYGGAAVEPEGFGRAREQEKEEAIQSTSKGWRWHCSSSCCSKKA